MAGTRRETLPIDKLYAAASDDPGLKNDLPFCDCEVLVDRTYFLPLGDRSWPDDTLRRVRIHGRRRMKALSALVLIALLAGCAQTGTLRERRAGLHPVARHHAAKRS